MSESRGERDRPVGKDAAFDELVYDVSARIEAGAWMTPIPETNMNASAFLITNGRAVFFDESG